MSEPTDDSLNELKEKFRSDILKVGIISYDEQDQVWDIAKKCARKIGKPMAVGWGMYGFSGGTVIVPGVGSVTGLLGGMLAGYATGTLACTAFTVTQRKELRELLKNQE